MSSKRGNDGCEKGGKPKDTSVAALSTLMVKQQWLKKENEALKKRIEEDNKKWEETFRTFVYEAFDDKRQMNKKRKEGGKHKDEGTVKLS